MNGQADPSGFLDSLVAAWERAASTSAVSPDHVFGAGGKRVALRFAGTSLVEPILPALAEALVPGAFPGADLTVLLFESEVSGVPLPPAPWLPSAFGPRGRIEGGNDERFSTYYDIGTGTLRAFDRERRLGVKWVARAADVPYWERSFPLREFLHWAFRDEPLQLAHAAAVGRGGEGVLLAGPSGAGRSTTSLSCLLAGLDYAGDDYVLLETAPTPRVHSLYSSAKVEPANLARVPELAPLVEAPPGPGEKAVIRVGRHFPGRLSRAFELRTVVVPRVTDRVASHVVPVSPIEALQALAPTTLLHLPRGRRQTLRKVGRIARQLPAFRLELGSDREGVVRAVDSVLAGARTSVPAAC